MVDLVQTKLGSGTFDYRPSSDRARSDEFGPRRPKKWQSKRRAAKTNSSPATPSRFKQYVSSSLAIFTPFAFSIVIIGVLFIGWLYRNEGHLTAETGAGYWLGIVGASMMLLLLLYPLRKRIKVMRSWGRVSHWFGAHMMLGVIGPALMLLHSNFQLGSLNSSVALFAMLLVAGSGLVGRYLYSKIHAGLYGKKTEVRTLLDDADAIEEILGQNLEHAEILIEGLRAFEEEARATNDGLIKSLWAFLCVGTKSKRHTRRVRKLSNLLIADHCRVNRLGWWTRQQMLRRTNQYCALYFAAVKKAARFSAYERLFSWWHILHLPLFFLLVMAAIVHILAVHLY